MHVGMPCSRCQMYWVMVDLWLPLVTRYFSTLHVAGLKLSLME